MILFDQFPRNMFRGHAEQFATDQLALAIAKGASTRTSTRSCEPTERGFLYMPFQHSENLADQNRALLLFSELGDEEQLGYARKHRDIIERFGRFPASQCDARPSRRAATRSAAGDVLVPW